MRILVENSGYHLSNLGDVAMLQVTVKRLRAAWPEASIEVITYWDHQLEKYCPQALPVGVEILQNSIISSLPAKGIYTLVQLHKLLLPPLLSARIFQKRRTRVPVQLPISLYDALCGADMIVASGGGYITDSFKLHALGVLSVLGLAKKMGKPSAMFGQGIGPLGNSFLKRNAAAVLPGMDFISLREGQTGLPLLRSLGVNMDRVLLTGDDALETAYENRASQLGDELGVNLRIAHYSGVDGSDAEGARAVIHKVARDRKAALVSVPVSITTRDADTNTNNILVKGFEGAVLNSDGIDTPEKLVNQIGLCRVMVTGSYHAAVFALGQGIPTVCLTRSAYYDAKFNGLVDLYGDSCRIVSLSDPSYPEKLSAAIHQVWQAADDTRHTALTTTRSLVRLSREAYWRFSRLVAGNQAEENPRELAPVKA